MYRTDDLNPVAVLLGASTLQDFVTRWDALARIARQDADNLRKLKQARAAATRSAEQLMALQSEQAKALDALEAEVTRAKNELASSEAALRAYEARVAAARRPAAPAESTPAKETPTPPAPTSDDLTQELTGSGEWETAVASHYGRTFTGTGASGEKIGPYSMIVAHKTLAFGTLVEFEYNGKRAVARVADRGPFTPGRTFDLGPGVVRVLDFSGVHEVRYRIIAR
jgi:rare lipoprotein A (peptidoglycan hydrolase)